MKMDRQYASEIAARGLNLQPSGTPHKGEGTNCAMCARPILEGELSVDFKPGASFTEWLAMTPSKHLCGWCDVTTYQSAMRPLQRSVITREGIYPIGKDDNRAWFLLTPPEPPYVVVVSNGAATATFHLHWKTPVTLSNELVTVRIDDQITTIRRRVLAKAIEQCQELALLMHSARPEGKRKAVALTAPRHAFMSLDRGFSDTRHGRLRHEAIEAAVKAGRQDLLDAMADLSIGELWALATLAKAKPATPTRPEPITSPKSTTEAES